MPAFGLSYNMMTALESVAEIGNIQIFDKLFNAETDIAAWKCEYLYKFILSKPSVSYLAILSPLHRVVEANRLNMIYYLLNLKFAFNNFLLASIIYALSLAMMAIVSQNLAAYNLLALHIDLTFMSPIYHIYIFYLATTTLSLNIFFQIVKTISVDIVPPIILLHTLFYIVCFLLNNSYINHHSAKYYSSFYKLKCLNYITQNQTFHLYLTLGQFLRHRPSSILPIPSLSSLSSDYLVQTALFLYFFCYNFAPLGAQDIYGNTSLHYLASHHIVNTKLLKLILSENNGFGIESM